MPELIFLIEEAPEGGWNARALGESIFTEADDLDTLRARIREAVHCQFDRERLPRLIRLHFVHEEILAV